MATRATAIGKPLPNCPYVLPRSDENTPRTARVVARPSENETALQRPQDPQSSDRTRLSLLLRTWLPSIRSLTLEPRDPFSAVEVGAVQKLILFAQKCFLTL